MWSQNSDVIGSSRLCSQFATVTDPVVGFTQSLRVTMNSGVWAPKILGAQAFPQVPSLNCPLDQNRVDEHQVVLQQLATVIQSQVGRLKKSHCRLSDLPRSVRTRAGLIETYRAETLYLLHWVRASRSCAIAA